MAVHIRLARFGRKKLPFYRIVAADKDAKRDGRFIEMLGTFDPTVEPNKVVLKQDRVKSWVEQGAQLTDTAYSIVEREIPGYVSGKLAERKQKLQERRKRRKARQATATK